MRPAQAASREVEGKWLAVSGTEIAVLAATYGWPSRDAALADVEGEGLPEGDVTRRAANACRAYLESGEPIPEQPLDLSRFPAFTSAVLRAVAAIPRGEVRTYGEIAVIAGSPGAARAVGQVMAHNPLAPIVPCHRVVGAKGLVGFGGGTDGLPRKRAMLEREGAVLPFGDPAAGS
ncbi:MAG: methylated-DNA--[protein]-cysteine S-methyltransferase [Armatimonadia bacterium]|nr:methylated-DNA--[protein]-cysteine S-methyltransferase [Armatimonadia bacterium]